MVGDGLREAVADDIEQPVHHVTLTLIQRIGGMLLPEARLLQYAAKNAFCAINRPAKACASPAVRVS